MTAAEHAWRIYHLTKEFMVGQAVCALVRDRWRYGLVAAIANDSRLGRYYVVKVGEGHYGLGGEDIEYDYHRDHCC